MALTATLFYGGLVAFISFYVNSQQEVLQSSASLVFQACNAWYFKYRRNHADWEGSVLARKLALVVSVLMLALYPVRTCFVLLMILVAAYITHSHSRPFTSVENNILEQFCLGSLMVVVLSAALLYSPMPLDAPKPGSVQEEMCGTKQGMDLDKLGDGMCAWDVLRNVLGLCDAALLFSCAVVLFLVMYVQTKAFRKERLQKRSAALADLKDVLNMFDPDFVVSVF